MTLEKIARNIPASLWDEASEKLIDITLGSRNASKMPSDLAKTILYYWQRDQLATEVGLHRLLEASMILEPEKTVSLMKELGLSEIVVMLKETS
ncbi:hypothetical protein E3J49_02265 [Candidatus Bathyarchaeota archaeon]|nr:MAG: hypothetical protein E3J49_02265 [Candidatus Bathyarchaeota archaeon]